MPAGTLPPTAITLAPPLVSGVTAMPSGPSCAVAMIELSAVQTWNSSSDPWESAASPSELVRLPVAPPKLASQDATETFAMGVAWVDGDVEVDGLSAGSGASWPRITQEPAPTAATSPAATRGAIQRRSGRRVCSSASISAMIRSCSRSGARRGRAG